MQTHIELELPQKKIALKIKDEKSDLVLSGVSIKKIYVSDSGEEYFVKKPKLRTARAFFAADPHFQELLAKRNTLLQGKLEPQAFDPATERPSDKESIRSLLSSDEYKKYIRIQIELQKYVAYVKEVVLVNLFMEVLTANLIRHFFKGLIVAPENYLYIDDSGDPLILSQAIDHYCEFITEHPLLKESKKISDWEHRVPPKYIDIVQDETQAYVVGILQAMHAWLGHFDGLNNIDGSNGGSAEKNGQTLAAQCDTGNALFTGFDGLTKAETAAKNPQFFTPPGKNFFKKLFQFDYKQLNGYRHTVPFTRTVYPVPPRSLITDLYDFTASDDPELRDAQRKGFSAACCKLRQKIPDMQKKIYKIIFKTMTHHMSLEDQERVNGLLPNTLFADLPKILQRRARSLMKIDRDLTAGKSMKTIARTQFKKVYQSQLLPSEKKELPLSPASTLSSPSTNSSDLFTLFNQKKWCEENKPRCKSPEAGPSASSSAATTESSYSSHSVCNRSSVPVLELSRSRLT